jgi:Ca2+-binding EF-hand superfamily protein
MGNEDFDAIEMHGDGYISASALLRALAEAPDADREQMATVVTMADVDKDNKVSFEEYAAFVR